MEVSQVMWVPQIIHVRRLWLSIENKNGDLGIHPPQNVEFPNHHLSMFIPIGPILLQNPILFFCWFISLSMVWSSHIMVKNPIDYG